MNISRAGFLKRMVFAFGATAFAPRQISAEDVRLWLNHTPSESARIVSGYIRQRFPGPKEVHVDWNEYYKEATS